MLSNGQEIILFVILLIVGLIYLNKYFNAHKVVINKFVFTVSILHGIIIIFLQEPNKSNISTDGNTVIWVFYIVTILFYKIIKDEEYKIDYFLLFLILNILGTTIIEGLYPVVRLLFSDKELIIKNIFVIVGSGLLSGFLYTFFKKCHLMEIKGEGIFRYLNKYEETIDKFIFSLSLAQVMLLHFTGSDFLLHLIYFVVFITYFIKDKEYKLSYFLLFMLVNFVVNLVIVGVFIYMYFIFENSSIMLVILQLLLGIAVGLDNAFFYQYFKKISMSKQ